LVFGSWENQNNAWTGMDMVDLYGRDGAKETSKDHDPLLNGSPGMKRPFPAMSGDEWG